MRYTAEPNQNVRTVPAGEVWVGIIDAATPYIVIATRLDDGERVMISRLSAGDAMDMAGELARLAHELNAPNN